jgi:hypothetical protein
LNRVSTFEKPARKIDVEKPRAFLVFLNERPPKIGISRAQPDARHRGKSNMPIAGEQFQWQLAEVKEGKTMAVPFDEVPCADDCHLLGGLKH